MQNAVLVIAAHFLSQCHVQTPLDTLRRPAQPSYHPSDDYIARHETKQLDGCPNPLPTRALFWARQGGLLFQKFRHADLGDDATVEEFKTAIAAEMMDLDIDTETDTKDAPCSLARQNRERLMRDLLVDARRRIDPNAKLVSCTA